MALKWQGSRGEAFLSVARPLCSLIFLRQLLENMDNLAALGDKTKEMEAGAKQFAANAKALAKSMGA